MGKFMFERGFPDSSPGGYKGKKTDLFPMHCLRGNKGCPLKMGSKEKIPINLYCLKYLINKERKKNYKKKKIK